MSSGVELGYRYISWKRMVEVMDFLVQKTIIKSLKTRNVKFYPYQSEEMEYYIPPIVKRKPDSSFQQRMPVRSEVKWTDKQGQEILGNTTVT